MMSAKSKLMSKLCLLVAFVSTGVTGTTSQGTYGDCPRGLRWSPNGCVAVQVPENGEIDLYGHDWVCKRGYRQSGNSCVAVQVPENGEIDLYGHDWVCKRGFELVSGRCLAITPGIDRSRLTPPSVLEGSREIQPLGYFVGNWNVMGQIVSSSFGTLGKFTGRYHNHLSTDGLSLISEWTEQRPTSSESGQSTYEYDPELKAYVCSSVDSSGEKETSVGNVDGQTWTWLSSHTTADGNLGGRFTIKQESAQKYTFQFESQLATGEWELAIEGSASKEP